MKILVFGATGLVGRTMLKVLEERLETLSFNNIEVVLAASPRSAGKTIPFAGQSLPVLSPEQALAAGASVALFSAGAAASREWAPLFAAQGTYVIDNSSAWRKDPTVPLVVPEINADSIRKGQYLIANPNCSTIQMVLALAPLHRAYQCDRIVVSTYQSVSGSGMAGMEQLHNERLGKTGPRAYPHPIDRNVIPQGGDFLPDGSTTEEEKLLFETRKILGDAGIRVAATVVRVPVEFGHSEAINVCFKKPFTLEAVRQLLSSTPGLEIQDDPSAHLYPMPLTAAGRDTVFVGRLRLDPSQNKTLQMWVVSDNLRKGAATNAIQIAEWLIAEAFV
jgi:aspartate-semialdehyde dehydrogenase